MQLPALLPNELLAYQAAASPDVLFEQLTAKPYDLLLFFQHACEDEMWSAEHRDFIQRMIAWLTKQAFADLLSPAFCLQAAKALRQHYDNLKILLPKDIVIQCKDGQFEVNSLLLAVISDFFHQTLLRKCRDKRVMSFALPQTTLEEFYPFDSFMSKGYIEGIEKMGEEQLLQLLHQAATWGVADVVHDCEGMLRKYLTPQNVFERLASTQLQGLTILKLACIDFINNMLCGFVLSAPSTTRLAIEFLDFTDRMLEYFQSIKPLVTDVICSGTWVDNMVCSQVMQQCPNLQFVDLSSTPVFSPNYNDIPASLLVLNLSQCLWVTPELLRSFSNICPSLEELDLNSDIQLNYMAWGELCQFKWLKKLSLAHCVQLTNDDLKIIIRGCEHLIELNLEGCRRLSEVGFFELSRGLTHLTSLNLARCVVSDVAMADIASNCVSLLSLSLAHCEALSEKGIVALVKLAPLLQELDLSHHDFSSEVIAKLQRLKPRLKLKT